MKNNKLKIGILTVLTILLSTSVFAFGVGFPYHEDHPLELPPGGFVDVKFNFQNPAGDEINFKASVGEGLEILTLNNPQEVYSIPVGGEVNIYGRITLPSDAKIGESYHIDTQFITVTESESGTFGLGASVGRKFNVVVVPVPEESIMAPSEEAGINWILYLIVGIAILLIIIIWYIIKKRKQKYSQPLPVV
ncbi:MAG: LPXTG cell wall anchor domain-containing protein [archaeon]